MKINKKLSAAITLSLMLGVYGSASADDHYLSGIDGTDGTFSVTDFAGNTVTVTTKAGGVGVRSWANYGSNSNATAHELTVAQGTWEYVSGGHRFGGDVNGNKVTIGTDVASGPLVQRIVIGGKTGGYSNKKAIGDAINNEVILVSGQVGGVTGGSADYGGNVINNKVWIEGGIVKRTDNSLGYIYGGWAGNSSKSIAERNEVHIEGGEIFARVSGGAADAGAIDNSVEIKNGVKVTDTVTGGYAYEGTLTGNKVTINYDAIVEKEVYGARSYKGTAVKNVVEVEEAFIGVYNSDTQEVTTGANVYGGFSYSSTKDKKFGVANENVVNISSSHVGNIYGGYAGIAAESNEVNIYSDTKISESVYGGYAKSEIAKSNIVKVTDARIEKNVFGGYVEETGEAIKNEVTIYSGEIVGTMVGGYAANGNATENKVTVEGGTVNALVGGSSDNGNAVKNVVTINGGAVKDTIIRGGWAMGSGAETGIADGNKVIITGADISSLGVSKIQGMVIGGTGATKAINNSVEVSGVKTANLSVIGGDSYNGETSGNTVIVFGAKTSIGTVTGGSSSEGNVYSNTVQVIEGAEVASANGGFATMGVVGVAGKGNKVVVDGGLVPVVVYGGQAAVSGDVSYNKVEIVSGTVGNDNPKFGMVYGGYTKKGTASRNEVTITGGEITGDVYGGVSEDGAANDNIVNLGGYDDGTKVAVNKVSVNLAGKVIGGQGKSTKGNTLNVFSKDNVVGALEGFQVEKFYMPGDTKPGDNFVKSASDVNMDGIEVKVALPEGNPLTYGDKVKLINAPAVSNMSDVREARAKKTAFTDWVFKVYQGDDAMNQVASGANNVVAELVDDAVGEDSKSLVETMAAATTILADGSDLLASVGFANAAAAVNAAGGDSEKGSPNAVLTIFGAANGNKSRVKSGSYVDVKGWNFNLGAAKEVKNRFGKLLFAPVVEYGIGSYDSYLNDGYHGEGETKFVGGGLMAKQTNNNGFYLEGSVRAGKMSVDYQSNDGKYDSDSPYLAAHFGLGKVLKVNDKNNVDIYGKYFYSHQSGDDVTLHGTDKNFDLSFDSVNSHRTRLGARFNHIVRDTKSLYAGLAWQHEFSSTARATIDGMTTPAPSMKGDTGILELGVKVNEGEHLGLDLGVTGSIGKKKGAGLSLNFNWKF